MSPGTTPGTTNLLAGDFPVPSTLPSPAASPWSLAPLGLPTHSWLLIEPGFTDEVETVKVRYGENASYVGKDGTYRYQSFH